jgi:hypothetical protein
VLGLESTYGRQWNLVNGDVPVVEAVRNAL